jgi:hypothetical protein
MKNLLMICVILISVTLKAEYSDLGFRAPIESTVVQDLTGLNDLDVAWLRIAAQAIQIVETGGEADPAEAIGTKGEVGPLQIRRCVLIDVEERYGEMFTLKDVKHLDTAVEVFCLYTARYNKRAIKARDLEKVSRCWNGGPEGHRKAKTLEYASKVSKEFSIISAE